jgi:ubiquitin-protein ligase
MVTVAIRRLSKELAEVIKDPPPLCTAGLKNPDENLFVWSATIAGPPDTPYDGGLFNLTLVFPPSKFQQ